MKIETGFMVENGRNQFLNARRTKFVRGPTSGYAGIHSAEDLIAGVMAHEPWICQVEYVYPACAGLFGSGVTGVGIPLRDFLAKQMAVNATTAGA